jgi:hypothetical protein
MDDYEKLQWELQELYTVYLERFRNLEYLEMELDHLDRAEQEKMEDADRHLKKMQRKMRDEVRCVRNCFRTSKRERERAFCGSCAASGGAGVVVRAHRFPPSNAALWARWHAFDSLGTLTTQNPHPNRRCAF